MAEQTRKRGMGLGLAKGLSVTLKTMLQPSVTQQYPRVKPDLPPRTRGVIALKDAGIESVKLPPRSPNLNAHAERFVRSIKQSCLERPILFGESSLRTAVQNFVAHYHSERNHQGLSNRLIAQPRLMSAAAGISNAASDWAER